MRDNLIVFLSHYDNFLDIMIGIDTPPESFKEAMDEYKLKRKGISGNARIELDADILLKYIGIVTKI